MAKLKPGATYIYEKVNGVIYAREYGKTNRIIVGYEYDSRTIDGSPMTSYLQDESLWRQIRKAAEKNPELKLALDRVKVLYYLIRDKNAP